jgi:hypothetical protein
VGQIVNNCSKAFPANVVYHELSASNANFDRRLRLFLPNVNYGGQDDGLSVRVVPLIATKDLSEGQELFSTYFSVVEQRC